MPTAGTPWQSLRRWTVVALLFSLLLIVALGVFLWRQLRDEVVYIAHFERLESNVAYSQMHRIALSYYLEQLSEEVEGYRFVLDTRYIENDPDNLVREYRRIADDPRYVLAFDNTWAMHVQAIAPVVRQERIPVLSLNADKAASDFDNLAVFIGHSDHAAKDLTSYLREVLRKELDPRQVVFVTEEDYWLTSEFVEELDKLAETGLEVGEPIKVPDARPTTAQQTVVREKLLARLGNVPGSSQPQGPSVLVLNVHNAWGHWVIDFVDRNLEGVTILAGAYAASEGRLNRFGFGPGDNQLILLTEPEDAVSKVVARDIDFFKEHYPDVFLDRFNAPFFVRRCLDAVEIAREALLAGPYDGRAGRDDGEGAADADGEGEEREPAAAAPTSDISGKARFAEPRRGAFRTFFRERLPGESLAGRHDLYSFDEEGRLVQEISFVEYDRGIPRSRTRQLNSDREPIPTVFFGIDLLDIGRLDPVNGQFRADFYYWVKLDPEHREMEELIHFRNLSRRDVGTSIVDREDSSYRLERISGEFNVEFDLADYPLDRQELTLELELANPFDNVRVAFDYAGFERNRRSIENFDIPGWRLDDYYVTVDNIVSRSLRGSDTNLTGEPQKYKTLTVRIGVERKVQSAMVSIALPLSMIAIAALSLLFIRRTRFSAVGDVYTGIFLSIVTYSIAYAQLTPSANVLTKADLLFYLTFLVVLGVFLRFIIRNALGVEEPEGPAKEGRQVAGYLAVAGYVAALVWILLR